MPPILLLFVFKEDYFTVKTSPLVETVEGLILEGLEVVIYFPNAIYIMSRRLILFFSGETSARTTH